MVSPINFYVLSVLCLFFQYEYNMPTCVFFICFIYYFCLMFPQLFVSYLLSVFIFEKLSAILFYHFKYFICSILSSLSDILSIHMLHNFKFFHIFCLFYSFSFFLLYLFLFYNFQLTFI